MDIQHLEEYITGKLRDTKNHFLEMRKIVSEISVPHKIQSLLQSILENPTQIEKIASNSFTHTNGFDKFILISSLEPEYRLRLHIWWPDHLSTLDEHIHDHSWNFSSAMITGNYKFQIFKYCNEGEELFHYQCGFPDEGTGYKIKFLGKTKVKCTFECEMVPSSVYSLNYSTLHKITNLDKLTSTITLHRNFIRMTSNLLSAAPLSDESDIISVPFSKDQFRDKIQYYLATISKPK